MFHYPFFHFNYQLVNGGFLGIPFEGWVAIGTFLAVLVALFGEKIKDLIFRPKLIFKPAKVLSQIQGAQAGGAIRYSMYRILVKNIGSPAYDVRASVVFVNKELPLAIPLNWTHIDFDTRDISREESVYLDIFQKFGSSIYFYGWRDKLIDSEEYKLANNKKSEIKIAFFERNRKLQSISLLLDPINETLNLK